MNKLSVMTLGFLKETVFPYMSDGDKVSLIERYSALLEEIKISGFSYIDVSSFEVNAIGVEEFLTLLEKHNLNVACLIHIDDFGAENECQYIETTNLAIDLAATLGTEMFMVVVKPHAEMSGDYEYNRKIIAKNCKGVVEYAKKYGITVVAENYPDLTLGITRACDVKEFLGCANGVKLVFDTGNVIIGEEYPVKFLDGFDANEIAHVHIKDVLVSDAIVNRGERLADGRRVDTVFTGEGIVDIDGAINVLKQKNYKGYYVLEYAGKQGVKRKDALAYCKQYIEQKI